MKNFPSNKIQDCHAVSDCSFGRWDQMVLEQLPFPWTQMRPNPSQEWQELLPAAKAEDAISCLQVQHNISSTNTRATQQHKAE